MPVVIDGVEVKQTAKAATQNFGYDVAKGNVQDVGRVNKFGYNAAVGATLETIWDYSGTYQYLADDTFATMYISSDAGGDTGLVFNVQGIDDEYNSFSVDVTTNGVTFVAIDTGSTGGQAWRVFRALNTSSTAATGNIYISKDNTDVGGNGIPDTVTDIQAQVLIGMEQTLMALWTVPGDQHAYLTHFYASTSSALVTEVRLYYRPFGGVFNIKYIITINAGNHQREWEFPDRYEGKGDFKVEATAAGGGGKVAAGFTVWHEEHEH